MRVISAHAPTAKNLQAREVFFKVLGKYVVHPYRLLMFIDANARPEEDLQHAKSGNNECIKEAAAQFLAFLDTYDLSSTHQVPRFTNSTSNTWTSPRTSCMHTIDYVVTKSADIVAAAHAATLPTIDNGHMLQDHVPSAAALFFQSRQ